MRVSCPLISTIILLAGQSQSTPILGPNRLESRDGLVGRMTHSPVVHPAAGGLNDGSLGTWNSEDVLWSPPAANLLAGPGDSADAALVSTAGLLSEPTLNKKPSLPLISEMGNYAGGTGTETQAQSMASDLGSTLSGPLQKRDTFSAFDAALERTPFIGYIPGIAKLRAIPSLPIIRDIPGISLVPGLGTTKAPSGFVAALTQPILAALPINNKPNSANRNSNLLAPPKNADIQSPPRNLTSSFSGIVQGIVNVPGSLVSLL